MAARALCAAAARSLSELPSLRSRGRRRPAWAPSSRSIPRSGPIACWTMRSPSAAPPATSAMRLSFVVPMRDQMTLGYAPDEALLGRHDPRDHDIIRRTWLYPFPSPAEYMDAVKAVAAACEGPMVTIQYGPNSPYACSDALLERLAAESAGDGRRIQTHLLETHAQREWADATYKGGFLHHLDELGLLSPRFSGAHGVWLRPQDCDLLAERGAAIAVNTSSNMRSALRHRAGRTIHQVRARFRHRDRFVLVRRR